VSANVTTDSKLSRIETKMANSFRRNEPTSDFQLKAKSSEAPFQAQGLVSKAE
jgi:hypothetical protein